MILRARNISKSFRFPQKVQILSEISLDVAPGESLAICGRSGEGKTTLLHILGILEAPDAGTVEIAGKEANLSNAPQLRLLHIGFIFQSYNLLEDFTALENVLMPAHIARAPINKEKGRELLDLVGLVERSDFPAKLLSGGEKQRTAIARALCNDPGLILADEPSGNLDSENATAIGSLLLSLVKEKKKSLILVTHDPALAALCDRRLLLQHGKIVQYRA